jgi:8-oxo-dGTP diphosphatase
VSRRRPRRFLHIAAGALRDARGRILVCQRPAHKLYPGEWEFPGGKVERGEDARAALCRELREELGIGVRACRPLIRLRHVYPELSVDLDTWLVTAWDGEPRSSEHPAAAWVRPDELPRWPLLAADRPIVNALRLPEHYVFTPPSPEGPELLRRLDGLPRGLLRLRWPAAGAASYGAWVRDHAPAIREVCAGLMVDRHASHVRRFRADGFHATAAALRRLRRRPVPRDCWFAASVHSAAELARARRLGADFVVLGPVNPTATHPGARALGWARFARLARHAGLPVYAIGGLGPEDLDQAFAHGAQGVAGISAYWGGRGSGGGSSGSASTGIE